MEEPQLPSLQLAKLRRKLDETAARHAEEIGALRSEILKLERALGSSSGPPPLPKTVEAAPAEEPEAAPIPEPEEPAGELEKAAILPDLPPKSERPSDRPPPDTAPIPESKPPVDRGRLELDLGRVWLVRIGIVLLVTGLVLLGNYAYQNWIRDLPAAVRLGFLVLSSLLIGGAGWACTRRDKLRAFGEVVLAGGMAFFYWCAYAAHHIERLRVVDSVVVGTLVLLAAAAAIVAVSVLRNARTTAVMGLLLASYSTMLQPMSTLTAVSNLLLAATGVTLVAAKRWQGPGFASMLGAYAAFLYWQLTGVVGEGSVTVTLVFVAVLWAVFVVPTFGAMRGLDERMRAWWAGLNNGAGFGLFSLVWLRAGWENYWAVPAVWGLVWLALGGLGRRRLPASETHLVQGLIGLTLAMVLKLEGYHLGLGLALESLVMAAAFRRFGKRPELAFSVLSMLGAVVWVLGREDWVLGRGPFPVWSLAVVASLLAGASFLLRRSAAEGELGEAGRQAAGLGVASAAAVGLLWCWRLPVDWRPLVATLTAGLLGWRVIREETRTRMPEVFGVALVVGLAGLMMLLGDKPAPWSLGAVALLSGGAAWLWEIHGSPATPGRRDGWPVGASVAAWIHAVGFFIALGVWLLDLKPFGLRYGVELGFATAMPIAAWRLLKCPRLRSASVLLLGLPLVDLVLREPSAWWLAFAPAAAAWAVWRLAGRDETLAEPGAAVHALLSRAAGGLAWVAAWYFVAPEIWGDMVGLSVLGGWWVWRRLLPRKLPVELVAWSVAAAVDFFEKIAFEAAAGIPSGWGVSAALVAAGFLRSRRAAPLTSQAIGWSAVAVPAAWASKWLLMHHDAAALTILWTLLGFAWVSVGLWRRFAALRMASFALLLVALVKLFVHDVWKFDSFTRVAAFLALGVALVVLGFFYNRFAELLKRLVDEKEE